MKEQILNQYKEKENLLDSFKHKVENLLKDLIQQKGVLIHQINSRIKSIDSLSKKIDKKLEKYTSIDDVTDIVGVRIITYLESEVDIIADLICNEFNQDKKNSSDKRILKADQFGYRSFHIVAGFNKDRCRLTEYKQYTNLKCEIQIRSILQHAWAEIEHDIGYKGQFEIPQFAKRNFYRIAALLETADIEFVKLKNSLKDYEKSVSDNIKERPETVEINLASLKSFILDNSIVISIDNKISDKLNIRVDSREGRAVLDFSENLLYLNIKTIKELEDALVNYELKIIDFANLWMPKNQRPGTKLLTGISIFYLCYVLVGQKNDSDIADTYMSKLKGLETVTPDIGKAILEIYKQIN